MRAVDAVGDVRRVREGLETMGAARRDVKRNLLAVAEFEAFPVAVGRRGGAQIHDDVEDRAIRAAHEFGLAVSAADVHTAHDTAARAGKAVLHEGARVDPCGPHDLSVEGTGKETTFIYMRRRPEQQSTSDARDLTDVHQTSLRPRLFPPDPLPSPML